MTRLTAIICATAIAALTGACSGSSGDDTKATAGTVLLAPATTQLPDSDERVAGVNIKATLTKLFDVDAAPIEERLTQVEGGAALEGLYADLLIDDDTVARLITTVTEISFETPEVCATNFAPPGCALAITDLHLDGTKVFPDLTLVMNSLGSNEYQLSRTSFCGLLAYKQVICPPV